MTDPLFASFHAQAKYGFIAFGDPEDFLKAWKEYDGKYVGSRPIRLMKVRDDRYGGVAPVQIGEKKVSATGLLLHIT